MGSTGPRRACGAQLSRGGGRCCSCPASPGSTTWTGVPDVGGVDHLAVADVHAHVADRAVEEHQVAGLQLLAGDRRAHRRLAGAGVRQADPGRRVGVLHQARAVERVRSGGAPDVGVADLGQRGVDRLLGGAAGRDDLAGRRPCACRRATRGPAAAAARSARRTGAGSRRSSPRGPSAGRRCRRRPSAPSPAASPAAAWASFASSAAAATCGDALVGVAGDRVEGAQLVDELVGRAAGQHHVEAGEPSLV